MPLSRTTVIYGALTLAALGVVAFFFAPQPIPVDAAVVGRGPLQVTVDEDGETRAHDRYLLSSPVAGRVSRVTLHEGDAVAPDQVVAEVSPLPLSAREREEQLSRIVAAEALQRQSEERVRHAEADREQALRERQRIDRLQHQGFVSAQEAEQANVAETTSGHELEAARYQARFASAEVEAARAALLAIDSGRDGHAVAVPIRSPVAGKVLRVVEQSERVVAAGTPIVTVGDPGQLEVVVDVLSNEAVRIRPGMPVLLGGWGEEQTLRARVRVVEPYGFTKVSALGVEEQRVNVVADFLDPPGTLGDGYRVDAQIVVWAGDDVVKVPTSALFRHGAGWSVFVVEGGRARRRDVTVGHRGTLEAEIPDGMKTGETVIRHPSNDVDDRVRVRVALQP
jgi:HlyD family secretion protein